MFAAEIQSLFNHQKPFLLNIKFENKKNHLKNKTKIPNKHTYYPNKHIYPSELQNHHKKIYNNSYNHKKFSKCKANISK